MFIGHCEPVGASGRRPDFFCPGETRSGAPRRAKKEVSRETRLTSTHRTGTTPAIDFGRADPLVRRRSGCRERALRTSNPLSVRHGTNVLPAVLLVIGANPRSPVIGE